MLEKYFDECSIGEKMKFARIEREKKKADLDLASGKIDKITHKAIYAKLLAKLDALKTWYD